MVFIFLKPLNLLKLTGNIPLVFDIDADLYGDKNAEKHANDGICPYDVVMSGGGLLRGSIVNEMLVRFNTYIDKDSMFHNQLERHDEMISEYYQMKRTGNIE